MPCREIFVFGIENRGRGRKLDFVDRFFSTGKNLEEKLIEIIINLKYMSIEIKLQSVTLTNEQVMEQFPGLIAMVNSYLPKKKTSKRRRRKKKETVGPLIKEIIDSIEK